MTTQNHEIPAREQYNTVKKLQFKAEEMLEVAAGMLVGGFFGAFYGARIGADIAKHDLHISADELDSIADFANNNSEE